MTRTPRQKHLLGLVLLGFVVLLWVASSTLIQAIFKDMDFDHPFFVTYLSTSMFTMYLVSYQATEFWNARRAKNHQSAPPRGDENAGALQANELTKNTRNSSSSDSDAPPSLAGYEAEAETVLLIGNPSQYPPFTVGETAKLSLTLCPLWFAMNYLFNRSLDFTSVASNTILSTTSSLFVLLFTRVILHTPLRFVNIAGVLTTIGGAVLVSYRDSDGDGGDNYAKGDLISLSSAVVYALYTTVLKFRIQDDSQVNMQLLFGFIGLFNILLFWPCFWLFPALDFESPMQQPPSMVVMYLLLNGFFGSVISDFCWAKSVVLTAPLIATMGLSLTIPLAMISDWVVRKKAFSYQYLLGSICVLTGFVLVNWVYQSNDLVETVDSTDSSTSTTPLTASSNADMPDSVINEPNPQDHAPGEPPSRSSLRVQDRYRNSKGSSPTRIVDSVDTFTLDDPS